MNGRGRADHLHPLRAVEEVTPMTQNQSDDRTPEEIADLFALAGGEGEAIERLDACVDDLRQVQLAKAELLRLTPEELRAGLAARRSALTRGRLA